MINNDFYKFTLPLEKDLFKELSTSAEFEALGKGRKGNHLVDSMEQGIAIVRTTTMYQHAAERFAPIHRRIIENIKTEANQYAALEGQALSFNNALIEIYDAAYTKMNYHSDQCLDLAADSYIALFSCYENAAELLKNKGLRILKIKSKITEEEFEIPLENNSVILFPLSANSNYLHKIILAAPGGPKIENNWLGITFRQSKTFIQFKDNLPYFANGQLLRLANEAETKEFYQLRGTENNSTNFIYPDIPYTLSLSDTLPPK